jgi:hypothetical protein
MVQTEKTILLNRIKNLNYVAGYDFFNSSL